MIEYYVVLKQYREPDVCIFQDEDRDLAIKEMDKYRRKNGFTIVNRDGKRFTVRDIVLIEKEPIVGAPVLSETPYYKLFERG